MALPPCVAEMQCERNAKGSLFAEMRSTKDFMLGLPLQFSGPFLSLFSLVIFPLSLLCHCRYRAAAQLHVRPFVF